MITMWFMEKAWPMRLMIGFSIILVVLINVLGYRYVPSVEQPHFWQAMAALLLGIELVMMAVAALRKGVSMLFTGSKQRKRPLKERMEPIQSMNIKVKMKLVDDEVHG